jgi:transposase
MLETRRACLKAAADKPDGEKDKESTGTAEESSDAIRKLTKAEKQTLERRAKRQERYETVKELYQRGLSKSEIARRLNISWRTVSKYVRVDECPLYAGRRSGSSSLAPYMDYMTKRWEEGCHNATQIWHEIRGLGFGGARRTVGNWATKKRRSMSVSEPMSKKIAPWSASRASWLLVKQEEELTEDDKQALERMRKADEKIAEAYDLGQRFTVMIRERQPESLLPWLEDVAKSRIGALTGFAKGIKQDLAAVTNALSLPWSNGQTEGQVNRLKLIKRQMYSRANFDLLRKRVIGGPVLWDPG